ncbi:type IV secretion system protein virB10 [Anaplasma platys]|uniref:Type IV secretion system protein virB10 n=1 Tax=Anaplasma platys TaxID=949 RepID=A0A858PX50_9RICK|nr:TrbI/VirB10 family protein [Anaplasma platys]QJC27166.1 type IV secretion system protein virB10 [Anaplasma platys]
MVDNFRSTENEEHIEEDVNIVGGHRSKKLFVILLVALAACTMYYFFFLKETPAPETDETSEVVDEKTVEKFLREAESPAQETAPRILTPPPKLPELPPLVMPSVPDIPVVSKILKPVPEPEAQQIEVTTSDADDSSDELQSFPLPYKTLATEQIPSFLGYDREKRGAPMIALGGGGDPGQSGDEAGGASVDGRFTSWHGLEGTASPSVKATMVGDPRYVILQGHMIDAVLETAINSDVPGVLRAIVSRDVYAEAGDLVLIPKGSRLIGSYFFDNAGKSLRVNISWSRVILPHGIDIQINSGGTDELGRNGIAGVVDHKVGTVLTSTILLAGVSLGTAYAAAKIPALQSEIVKTTSTKDTPKDDDEKKDKETTSSTLPAKIVSDAVKDFSESVKSLINKYSDSTPTIYIDQGTLMRVFVNQDIIFPRGAVRKVGR